MPAVQVIRKHPHALTILALGIKTKVLELLIDKPGDIASLSRVTTRRNFASEGDVRTWSVSREVSNAVGGGLCRMCHW